MSSKITNMDVTEQLLKSDRAYKSDDELVSVRNSSHIKIDLYAHEIEALIGRNGSRRIIRIFLTRMEKELQLADQANNILCASKEPESMTEDFRAQMKLTEVVDDMRIQVDIFLKNNHDVEECCETEQESQSLLEDHIGQQLSIALPLALPLAPRPSISLDEEPSVQPNSPVINEDMLAFIEDKLDPLDGQPERLMANQLIVLVLAVFVNEIAKKPGRFSVKLFPAHSSTNFFYASTVTAIVLFFLSVLVRKVTQVPPCLFF